MLSSAGISVTLLQRNATQLKWIRAGWPPLVPRHPRQLRGVPPASAGDPPGIRLNDNDGTLMLLERHEWDIDVVSGRAASADRASRPGAAGVGEASGAHGTVTPPAGTRPARAAAPRQARAHGPRPLHLATRRPRAAEDRQPPRRGPVHPGRTASAPRAPAGGSVGSRTPSRPAVLRCSFWPWRWSAMLRDGLDASASSPT
jgi:hypothetical protein